MNLTRADFEAALVDERGLGPWLASVGLDGSTRDGTNRALVGPLRRALGDSGYPVSGWLSVTTADIQAVGSAHLEEVLDRAHLYALIAVRDAWSRGDDRPGPTPPGATSATPTARDLDYRRLLGIIADMQRRLDEAFGDSAGRVTAGTIRLGFLAPPEAEY